MKKGYTLIELVAFIAIIGVLVVAALKPFGELLKHTAEPMQMTRALNLAKMRMELILGQRYLQGFDSFTDPCSSTPLTCQPSGFSVTTSITDGWSGAPSDTNYKTITVTVSGNGQATLTTMVAKD